MSLYFRHNNRFILVSGNTYTHKEELKSLGASFLRDRKAWRLAYSEERLEAVKKICHAAGGSCLNESSSLTASSSPELSMPVQNLVAAHIKTQKNKESPALEKTKELSSEEKPCFTVRQILAKASAVVSQAFTQLIWVKGEVQNLNLKGQVCYFMLAEEASQNKMSGSSLCLSSVIWSSQWENMVSQHGLSTVNEVLSDGMEVCLLAQVSFYQGRGSLSLVVHDIDLNFTKGRLALARENILKKLRQKGLDKKNKMTYLPFLPLRIGLLTAEGSRAYSDFINQLFTGLYPGEIIFCSCAMQGDKVTQDLSKALKILSDASCDLIVITRGGGSAADLRYFDDLDLALAVSSCSVPIVSAIGHYDDKSVLEEVSYYGAQTPTAAADFINQKIVTAQQKLQSVGDYFARSLQQKVHIKSEALDLLAQNFYKAPENYFLKSFDTLQNLKQSLFINLNRNYLFILAKVNNLSSQLFQSSSEMKNSNLYAFKNLYSLWTHCVDSSSLKLEQSLDSLMKSIQNLDPSPWLQKGWTQLQLAGKKINSVKELEPGKEIQITLLDGSLDAQITHIKKRKENK